MLEEIIIVFSVGLVGYVIAFVTRDIIWRSRLKDNNLEFKGWNEEGYSIIENLEHR